MTFRYALRRSRKSHPLYVLTPSPHAAVPSRRSDVWAFRRADVPKSLPFNLFADPHRLNPAPSIFYKKVAGRGALGVQMRSLHSERDYGAFQRVSDPSPLLSYHCKLFCTCGKHTFFVFKQFRTLCQKPPGVGVLPTFKRSTFKPSNAPSVLLRRAHLGATIGKGARNLQDPGKQLRSPRCLRIVSGHRGQLDLGPQRKSCLGPAF